MKKSRFTNNLGFTLVEMLVVLTVLAIVLGASMWATTGWIHHFTYMQNEEKARYIYLGAQSGLSAYSGRGTLDELFEDIDDLEETGELVYITPENKEALGLPIEHDNRDQDHEYAYLSVPAGKLDSNVTYSKGGNFATMKKSETFLYKLVSPYMSDAKSIEGSIVIELDMTSQKVYSVFYSSWADEFLYGTSDSVVRGTFYINKDSRTKDARYDHCVGYYGSDQVNVINLTLPNGIKVEKALLVNEETLHLDFYSDAENLENYTMFNITFYAKGENGNADEKLFTVEVDPSDTAILGPMAQGTKIDPKPVMLKTTLADGTVANLPFFLGYLPDPNDPDERYSLSLTVDAMMDSQSMALLNKAVDGKTDTKGLSITRFAGDKAKLIYADIEVSANAAGAGVLSAGAGQGLTSNIENDLYATEKDVMNEPVAIDDSHNIIYWRHLSNVRYGETYYERESSDTARSYNMTTDLQWSAAKEYAFSGTSSTIDELSGDKKIWPSIPSLGNKATLNAIDTVNPNNNYALFGVRMDNTSYITYDYAADGKPDVTAGNKSSEIGFVANNHGTISGLSLYDTSLYAYTNDQAKTAGKENSNGSSIYSDTLRAAGLLTGRNDGILSEIYIDKDSLVDATVTMDNSVSYTNGCGVGILSGTISLRNGYPIDRVYINGSLKGDIADAANTPAVSDTAGRKAIYSNASKYAYGVGAVSGYVYGDYNAGDEIGIGITKAANYHNIKLKKLEAGQITDDTGYVFDGWTDNGISVINKAPVTSTVSFAGGIAGNIYIAHLNNGSVENTNDGEGDWGIPSNAVPQIVNCRNYGDIEGRDFVGGIVGVNGNNGYIKECISYGGTQATFGVSAGIASENFGFIENCSLDRSLGDANHTDAYIPVINGNMDVAGAITCINHDKCVVLNCSTSESVISGLTDKILISGNYMGTFGYLVGNNDGVVNGGVVGPYVGYESKKRNLTVGGAVGENAAGAVVKHISGAMDLKDNGQATYIGGIVGNNRGTVKSNIFSGTIEKKKTNVGKMAIGGIVAQNLGNGKVESCYLVGGKLDILGYCSYTEDDDENTKLAKSSYVGGICGINNTGCSISNCYVTSLSNSDATYSMKRQSYVLVQKGMVGGIVAVNRGTLTHCGYTDKIFVNDTNINNVTYGYPVALNDNTKDMVLLDTAAEKIKGAMSGDAASLDDLNNMFKVTDVNRRTREDQNANKAEGDMTVAAEAVMGELSRISVDANKPQYAWSRAYYGNNYSNTVNKYIVTLGNLDGRSGSNGYVGGIAGYNTANATLTNCASGKWIVESYLPTSRDAAVGGIVGENASNGNFIYNINFAYVRRELETPAYNDSDYNSVSNTKTTGAGYHRFHYVGGVTGVQSNITSSSWVVEGCVNVGTVVNYYGNNVGGVISKITHNCGTVRYCYNYGLLMTGAEFNAYSNNAGWCGTAGGVVNHITKMNVNQTMNIISCQNHGIVDFPMMEVDMDTDIVHKYVAETNRISLANDGGGVVGCISASNGDDVHILNVIDCVNGSTAKLYVESQGGGILGFTGGKTNETDAGNKQSSSVLVNVDSCRNYSSYMYCCASAKDGTNLRTNTTNNIGGILGNRDEYPNDKLNNHTGFTSMQNCITMRMYRFQNGGYYNNAINMAIGIKNGARYLSQNQLLSWANNYYIDELTYHYTYSIGRLKADGTYENISYNPNNWSNSYYNSTCARISGSFSEITALKEVNKKIPGAVKIEDKMNYKIGLSRLQSVAYGDKYALIAVRDEGYFYNGNKVNDILNVNSAWIDTVDGYKVVKVRDDETHEDVIYGDVIYEFTEVTPLSGRTYDYNTVSFQTYAGNRYNSYRSGTAYGSRIPTADEYDMDIAAFDRAFVQYIARLQANRQPDKVINVNITLSSEEIAANAVTDGGYNIRWDVKNATLTNNGTANEFDMVTSIYQVPKGAVFGGYIDESGIEITGDGVVHLEDYDEQSVVVGRYSVYTIPEGFVFEDEYDYYVVARVRDSISTLGADYSIISNTEDYKSYAKLLPKLPTPELEIVEYEGQWYLHLLNPEDYIDYVSLDGFEIGIKLYKTNNTWENTNVRITKDNISTLYGGNGDESSILTNAVLIGDNKVIVAQTTANNRANGSGIISLRGYAVADGCLTSDVPVMNMYLPMVTDVQTTLSEVTDKLNDTQNKPEYDATFTYNKFSDTVTPSIAQIFRLELYGTKTVDGKKVNETIAHKEYSLRVGDSTDISIGYYDAPSDLDLSQYETFATEIWYASTGMGDVYNYFHTTEDKAANKLRTTGFITDYNDGVTKADYIYKSVKLPTPIIEPVIVGFTPDNNTNRRPVAYWGVRVVNYKEYEAYNDNGDIKVGVGFASTNNYTVKIPVRWEVPISGSDMSNKDGVNIYPAGISLDMTADKGDRTQWRNRLNAYACGEGKINSDTDEHLDGHWFVPYYMTDMTYFGATFKKLAAEDYDNGQSAVTGAFTFDGTNLNYKGVLSYNEPSKQGIEAYYKVEVYAYDASGNPITLYMSDDKLMTNTSGNSSTISTDPVNITLTNNKYLNLGDYHDYHVAVWYSANSNDDNHSNNYQGMIRYYFETEDQYVTGNYRNNGFIKYLDSTTGEYKYYYSAVLAYRDLCENNNYAKIYMENVTSVRSFDNTVALTANGAITCWTKYDTAQAGNKYTVEQSVYAIPIASGITATGVADLEANATLVGKVTTNVGGNSFRSASDTFEAAMTAAGTPVTLDFDNYIYYAVVRVKDSGTTDKYYSEKIMTEVARKLPAPIFATTTIDYTGKPVWYVYLVNWREFVGSGAVVHILNNGNPYMINGNPLVIDTANPETIAYNGVVVMPYAARTNFTKRDQAVRLSAYADVGDPADDTYIKTDTFIYNDWSGNTPWFHIDMNADYRGRIIGLTHDSTTGITYENGILTYTGTYTYSSNKNTYQSYMVEVYGYKEDGSGPYTIYMSEVTVTQLSNGEIKTGTIDIAGLDVSEYHNVHVAMWMTKSETYKTSGVNDPDAYMMFYYEITPEAAEALGCSRENGVITDISTGVTKYYFAASLIPANNTYNADYTYMAEDDLSLLLQTSAPGNNTGNNSTNNSTNNTTNSSNAPLMMAGAASTTEPNVDTNNNTGNSTDDTNGTQTDNTQTNTDNTAGDENQGVDNTTPTDANSDPASDPANTDSTNTDNTGNGSGENQDNSIPENPAIVPDTQNLGGSESANTDNTAGDSTQGTDTQATDTQNTDSQATDNNDNGGDSSANGN